MEENEKSEAEKKVKKSEVEKSEKPEVEKKEKKSEKEIAKSENGKTKTEEKKDNPVKTEKKKSKKIWIIVAIVVAICAICGIVYAVAFSKTTIDLSKYLKVDYSGFNGYGTADVKLNESEIKKVIKDSSVAKRFIKKLELETENTSGLSNGDEIKVKASISNSFLKDNRLEIKDKRFNIKVSGLKEVESLDLSKYIKLDLSGFNKMGSAEVKLDDSLKDVLGEKVYKDFKTNVDFNVKNNGKLENGKDAEIEVIIYDYWLKENGIELKSNDVKVKVDGLEEGKEVDGFSGLKVEMSGMSPNINLNLKNTSTDDFIKTIKYSAEKTNGISNGETVKITISDYDEDMAEKNGYVFKSETYDYKVEGQAAYVTKVSEITADVKTKVKSEFESKALSESKDLDFYDNESIKTYVYNNTDYRYSNIEIYKNTDLSVGTPELDSLYLLTDKEYGTQNDTNKLIGIVKIPVTSAQTGVTYNWFVTVIAKNFSLKTDGTISDNVVYDIKLDNGKDSDSAYQRWVNEEKDNYNVENVSLN